MTIYKATIVRKNDRDEFGTTRQSKHFSTIDAARRAIEEKTKLIIPDWQFERGMSFKNDNVDILIESIDVLS